MKLGEGRFNIVVDIVKSGFSQDQMWQIDVRCCLKGFISGVTEEKFFMGFHISKVFWKLLSVTIMYGKYRSEGYRARCSDVEVKHTKKEK